MSWPQLRSGVYFILPEGLDQVELVRLTEAALAGGVGMIQYREKDKSTRQMILEVTDLLMLTSPISVPLIVNDRVDVCLAAEADGVHVGQEDMPVQVARRLLGAQAIVGATTPSPQLAQQARADGASYAAIGPVFASPTKPEKPQVGVDAVRQVAAVTSLPVCAIGGIDAQNIAQLPAAGASLYAVVSAISAAQDPAEATAELAHLTQA
ncbi:MAG: thiamine phosphate synthase [candidate division WS1 bacterium]|jgi:thiamine-phosphate pyrophosphorylase|nr:thiamine phosphate synthase [candidate division WS1 bacterium]